MSEPKTAPRRAPNGFPFALKAQALIGSSGLAAEVEAWDEEIADILRMLDPAGREIVERRLGIGGLRRQAFVGVSEKFGLVS